MRHNLYANMSNYKNGTIRQKSNNYARSNTKDFSRFKPKLSKNEYRSKKIKWILREFSDDPSEKETINSTLSIYDINIYMANEFNDKKLAKKLYRDLDRYLDELELKIKERRGK